MIKTSDDELAGNDGASSDGGIPSEQQPDEAPASSVSDTKAALDGDPAKASREIKGNLPYTASPGSIKSVLDAIVVGERPDKLSNNYMETVFKLSGGGARSVPPLLKKMGFLQSDGTPTDLYSKFKTESGRGTAALTGLKQAYPEIFKKNEVAHRATEDQLRDIIIEITGLRKTDPVLRHMVNSFNAVKAYISDGKIEAPSDGGQRENFDQVQDKVAEESGIRPFGLSYHINVVLPESQDQLVYDAIFRSLRRNLLP